MMSQRQYFLFLPNHSDVSEDTFYSYCTLSGITEILSVPPLSPFPFSYLKDTFYFYLFLLSQIYNLFLADVSEKLSIPYFSFFMLGWQYSFLISKPPQT